VDDPTRALRITAVVVCAVWLPVLVVWGPAPFTLTFDDAYYYFQIGREIAHGHGSTFNGLDLTNGYHPLWQAICVLPFLVGLTGLAAVRALLVFQLALWGVTLWIVAGMLGDAIGGWSGIDERFRRRCTGTVVVLMALVAGNPAVLKIFVNGLESGVAAVAYAGLLALAVRTRRRAPVLLAVLLVLAFLGRTDAVFVIACLFVWTMLTVDPDERRAALLPFIPVTVVAIVYLAVNRIVFGEPLQVSGVVKREPLTIGRAVALLVVAVIAVLVAVGCRRLKSTRFTRTTTLLASTGWFAAACVLLVGYYRILSVEVYLWYYAPVALYLIVLLLHAAADFAAGVVAEGQSLVAVQAILVVPFVLALAFAMRQLLDPQLRSLQEGDRAAALWVRDNTAPGAAIGSWDSGIIGYFSDRPVVNLDGVVNSFEWKDALHHAPEATRAFLDARHVRLTVNHGELVNGEDPDIHTNVTSLYGPDVGVHQVHRDEYVYSGNAGGHGGTRRMATFVYEIDQ
jgi:hypothetical protein